MVFASLILSNDTTTPYKDTQRHVEKVWWFRVLLVVSCKLACKPVSFNAAARVFVMSEDQVCTETTVVLVLNVLF